MSIVIVGGGWSGLAAAITCIQQGQSVHLVESAKQLGGRARNVSWDGNTIDNGQHLMIGAYERMLAVMSSIGIDTSQIFQRQAIDLTIYDRHYPPLRLSSKSYLPWPVSIAWSLAASAGVASLIQVSRLQSDIKRILSKNDITVSEWLLTNKQSPRLVQQLWEPLCLATLNTPIKEASAKALAVVLRDSLGKGKSSADALIPRLPLGDIFPSVAAEFILQAGSKISLRTKVNSLRVEKNRVTAVECNNDVDLAANAVIIATNPSQASSLLAPYSLVRQPVEYPICTVYLQYNSEVRLHAPMVGMSGTVSQWIFDRSQQTAGLMAVVISGPGDHETLSKEALISLVCKEVHQLFPMMPRSAKRAFVIREKRATFASTVNIENERPSHKTDISGLWLAGDFVANTYPATLEGAIRNGETCAKQLLATI